mmetsp:Transcript_53101/g.95251  ORF Transcript_53101/g.95251 Transcript_53101/m.95251 type:complete len:107 (-) Transcript_53101:46-366(-)
MSQDSCASTAVRISARRWPSDCGTEEPKPWSFGAAQQARHKQTSDGVGLKLMMQSIPEDRQLEEVESQRDSTPPWNPSDSFLLQEIAAESKRRYQRRNHYGAYAWK